jgi:hypothetical protein
MKLFTLRPGSYRRSGDSWDYDRRGQQAHRGADNQPFSTSSKKTISVGNTDHMVVD